MKQITQFDININAQTKLRNTNVEQTLFGINFTRKLRILFMIKKKYIYKYIIKFIII